MKKLGIVRLGRMGDIICSEPIFRYLNKSGYRIDFITSSLGKEIFKYNNYIDNIVDMKKYPNKPSIQDFLLSAGELDDVSKGNKILDFHWYERGNVININRNGQKTPIHILNAYWLPSISDIYLLEVYDKLSINEFKGKELQPKIIIPSNVENSIISKYKDIVNKNYVLIQRIRYTTLNQKKEDKLWKNLINYIAEKNYYIVEIGGKDVANQGVKINNKKYIDLRGFTSFHELAVLMRYSVGFIGVRSGPSHIANAVLVPALIFSAQYYNYDFHNPYPGYFYSKGENVKLLPYKRSISEIKTETILSYVDNLLEYGKFLDEWIGFNKSLCFEYMLKINDFILNNDEFVIWGSGFYGKIIKKLLDNFDKKILCFIDSDSKKWGDFVGDVEVKSPNFIREIREKDGKIIVASMWWLDIAEILEKNFSMTRWKDYI